MVNTIFHQPKRLGIVILTIPNNDSPWLHQWPQIWLTKFGSPWRISKSSPWACSCWRQPMVHNSYDSWCSCGYGSIPIDTFLVGWTSIYQLFWCSPGVQGFDTLPCLTIVCYCIYCICKCCAEQNVMHPEVMAGSFKPHKSSSWDSKL